MLGCQGARPWWNFSPGERWDRGFSLIARPREEGRRGGGSGCGGVAHGARSVVLWRLLVLRIGAAPGWCCCSGGRRGWSPGGRVETNRWLRQVLVKLSGLQMSTTPVSLCRMPLRSPRFFVRRILCRCGRMATLGAAQGVCDAQMDPPDVLWCGAGGRPR